jgi:uncharacterized protein YbjT (DUF2867 family)
MKRTYVVTGGSGNTGKVVANELLKAGQHVKVIGREAAKLSELEKAGAELLIGDVNDETFLKKAFEGADGVYLMIAPPYQVDDIQAAYKAVSEKYLAAVKANDIKNIVWLSSIGVHDRGTKSIIQGLADMEVLWSKEEGRNIRFLRPTYFMENLLWQVGNIKQMGIMGTPIKGDLSYPFVATKDIGARAAKRLLNLDFNGVDYEYLLGPKNYSYNEATELIGKAIGKADLKYVEFPYSDAENAMQGMGMSKDAATRMVQLAKDMNEGSVLKEYKRTPENSTPTTLEEFANTFSYVYNM